MLGEIILNIKTSALGCFISNFVIKLRCCPPVVALRLCNIVFSFNTAHKKYKKYKHCGHVAKSKTNKQTQLLIPHITDAVSNHILYRFVCLFLKYNHILVKMMCTNIGQSTEYLDHLTNICDYILLLLTSDILELIDYV